MSFAIQAAHRDKVMRAIASGEAARSALIASWQRSARLHRLDPGMNRAPERLGAAELAAAREGIGALMAAAQPSLDRLFLAVGGVGCSVLLANREGIPLDRRGAAAEEDAFRRWGLWTGALWSEASEGTNGIGTCLAENRAVSIHRDQHFLARNAALSCMSAPIYDEHGELAAALDVSSCRADLSEGYAQLIAMAVQDAARRIEAETFRHAFARARVLVAAAGERGGLALLAVDSDDLVIGATRGARLALGLSEATLARRVPASDLLGGGGNERLEAGERAILQRALLRVNGNVSEAARALGISRATLHRKLNRFGLRSRG